MGDPREVLPGCARVRTKCAEKTKCWSVGTDDSLEKLLDLSGPGLVEAGRYSSFIYYKRDVKFVNKFVLTLSNKEMIKINIVDLEKLYNFVVKYFLI